MTSKYELLPSKSNINAYNRYPFANYVEAVNNLLIKALQPGELAVAYYWNPNTEVGIDAIFAIGNLKKNGNIIFKNSALIEELYKEIYDKVEEQDIAINKCTEITNECNAFIESIKQHIFDIDDNIKDLQDNVEKLNKIEEYINSSIISEIEEIKDELNNPKYTYIDLNNFENDL